MLAETSQSLLDRLQTDSSPREWEVFWDIYHPFIRRHLIQGSVPEPDVEDLSQEILTRVFKSLPSFRHNGRPGAFRCWLGKIVSQQRWQYLQQASHRPLPLQLAETAPRQLICEDELLSVWEAEHDRHVLDRLLEIIRSEFTRGTWLAFAGVTLDGRPSAEVARELGMSPNAVMIAKSRVLSRLRSMGRELMDSI